jgi:hypothetical protein
MSSHVFAPHALGLWLNGNLTQRRKDAGTQRRKTTEWRVAGSRPNGEITAGFQVLHSCRLCLLGVPASLRLCVMSATLRYVCDFALSLRLCVKIFLPAGIPGSFIREFWRFLRIQTKSGVFQSTKASQLYTRTELIHYDQGLQSSLTTFPNQQTRHQPPYLLKLPH